MPVTRKLLTAAALVVGAGTFVCAPAAQAAAPTWSEGPAITCSTINIDPPATFTVTYHTSIDGGTVVDTPATWGDHADPYIDTPVGVLVPGPHTVTSYATATVSNLPGATAVSGTSTVTLTCVAPATTTTEPATTTTERQQCLIPEGCTSTTTVQAAGSTTVPSSSTSIAIGTPTSVAAAPAAQQLPFTGSSSFPLGAVGGVFVAGGAAALAFARRRGGAA
jgi:hypothetical protein